jgi:hypothetical protein
LDAEISVTSQQRMNVSLKEGACTGRIAGKKKKLLRSLEQNFLARLDITVLDGVLLNCRRKSMRQLSFKMTQYLST